MLKLRRTKIALATLPVLCALIALPDQMIAQERVFAVKGGDTIEIQTVWSVSNCKSKLTAAPVVELLEGPPQVKLWVEPAMVSAARVNCPGKVAGGKLMAKFGTIEQQAETKITFRTIYQATDGVHHVARSYNITMFPGEEKSGPSEPSRSWEAFLVSAGLTVANPPDHSPPSAGGKSRSARKIIKKHKLARVLTRVASTDMAFPPRANNDTLYASCRNRVYKKYAWDGHDGKFYMERQVWIGMTDACVARGGQVP